MMRRLAAFAFLVLLALCVTAGWATVDAQGFRVTQPRPDCNLFAQRFDNPLSDTRGFTQPRVAWHLEYSAVSFAGAYAVHRVTHLPRWASAALMTTAIGVVPHVRSVLVQRRYPINPGDLAFDLVNRATPFIWTENRPSTKAAVTWLASDLALACFSSP